MVASVVFPAAGVEVAAPGVAVHQSGSGASGRYRAKGGMDGRAILEGLSHPVAGDMNALTLNLLGDLEVLREGQPLPLPPSKKTRALLAYLALHPRTFSREHLCDLLWELPDDPRGSLRWSLSKLRRLADDPERPRIIADRLCVGLDTSDIDLDVSALHEAFEQGPHQAPIDMLEAVAMRYRGPFLEGLDLSRFHDFHSWCLAERERAMRAQTAILSALVERLAETPERALAHAQVLVRLAPFDEDARAGLIRLLLILSRPREAEQHFQLGMRLLKEAGIPTSGALLRARRGTAGRAAVPSPGPHASDQTAAPIGEPSPPVSSHAGNGGVGEVDAALASLDPEAREVLRWAAVLAPCLDPAMLGRVTGLNANRIGEALGAAERLRLLEATERGLCFSHERVARDVYTGITPSRRQVMHRQVADLLGQNAALDLEHAADLVRHAQSSGDPGLAAEAMVTAGRLCLRFFANDEAMRLARQGLALTEQLSGARRVCLMLELRDVMLSAAPLEDWETTARDLVALAERALEHGALAHARLGYQLASQVRWAHGQWTGAHEEALQAERVTRSADDHDQVVAMAETAKCLAMLERDLDQAAAMLAQARALATQRRISHPAIPMALGLLAWHDSRLAEADEHFKNARTLCKATGDRLGEFQANEYLMMIDVESSRFAAARSRCATLMEIGERLRDGSEAPFARAAQAFCRYALDDDASPLEESLPALRHADAKHRLSYLLTQAALLDLARGRPAAARSRAEEALAHAQTLERATEQLLAHYVLAEAHRAAGDTVARRRHAAAVAKLEQGPVAHWARHRVAELLADREAEGET
ncbi:BTAD domain-containing putative transcriptional regulator [Halomonas sp. M4R5S39]|uniref:BTAD domain-containing putative transcriptional regulator n=1 Tax=Halomonas kalidii TaxID=3043293 RepID=UPI0024A9B491|nr:BTAD domain-containing putative transcriptional regulator [Halomonas kalidii]MDI5985428.1 BTAD domain-containing putative transcriptional regulator [Halomonas kalidii]